MRDRSALLDGGADVNRVSAGDRTSPLLIATINGQFDLAKYLLEQGADPNLASDAGATPLYAIAQRAVGADRSIRSRTRSSSSGDVPGPHEGAARQGRRPERAPHRKTWYSRTTSTCRAWTTRARPPFWRAAYGADVDAMRLLVKYGADPGSRRRASPSGATRTPGRQGRVGTADVPTGGPAWRRSSPRPASATAKASPATRTTSRRTACWRRSSILVEELDADVNAADHDGNTALHNAASRGDNEMILYLVSKGADVSAVDPQRPDQRSTWRTARCSACSRSPRRSRCSRARGAKNNHKCVSC